MVSASHLRRLTELEAARAAALARREIFVVFENFDFAFVDPCPAPKFTLVRQRGETTGGFEIRIMKQLSGWGRVSAVMADDLHERAERILALIWGIPKCRPRVPGAELQISTLPRRSKARFRFPKAVLGVPLMKSADHGRTNGLS